MNIFYLFTMLFFYVAVTVLMIFDTNRWSWRKIMAKRRKKKRQRDRWLLFFESYGKIRWFYKTYDLVQDEALFSRDITFNKVMTLKQAVGIKKKMIDHFGEGYKSLGMINLKALELEGEYKW